VYPTRGVASLNIFHALFTTHGGWSYAKGMSEKWEYKIIQNMALLGGDKKLIPELNALGQEGWEAVAVSAKSEGAIERVLLKRKLS